MTVAELGFQVAEFRVLRVFAGTERWGGCQDLRPVTIFGTGPTPVGVPVGASGWRCSKANGLLATFSQIP